MRNTAVSLDNNQTFMLSRDWLASREFIFRADARVLSRNLRFAPDGTIAGHGDANESFWDVVDGALQLMNAARQTTCVLSFSGETEGHVSLSGAVIDVGRPDAASGSMRHVEEKRPGMVPRIASFDLFDTLVARRCHEPTAIFQAVERKSGVADFAHLRHTFEMRLFGKTLYGLDDVYAALASELGWPPELVAKLKMLELMEEWDNLFPIAEIVARFGPNDIVISDMYLPYDFVRKIVEEKCGLRGKAIVLSNYGKHLGVVWPQILTQCEITRHYGDNVHADIASPSRFGIPTEHVAVSNWSQGERVLIDIGLRPCAEAIREARLRGDADPATRGVRAAQLEMNLPLLIVASYFLFQAADAFGADRVLLCARDCSLLRRVIDVLSRRAGNPISTRYIRTSRKLFFSDAPEYEAYFRNQLGEKNLLADMAGTGQSLAHFVQSAKLESRVKPVLVVGEPAIDTFGAVQVASLVNKDFLPVRLTVEALNTSLDGTALAAHLNNHAVEIALAPNEFSARGQELIARMHETVEHAVAVLGEGSARLPRAIALEDLRQAANALIALTPHYWERIFPLVQEQSQNLKH
jgi:hypothetical protein